MDEVVGKIDEVDYYKFALKMEEMQHEQSKLKIKEMQAVILEKDSDVLKMRIALHKQAIVDGRLTYNEVKKSYEELRNELSAKLGFELKDLVIDPITLEIKRIK